MKLIGGGCGIGNWRFEVNPVAGICTSSCSITQRRSPALSAGAGRLYSLLSGGRLLVKRGFQFEIPNKYRRVFDWRISSPQRESPETVTRALFGLSRSELPDILEDFLDLTRKRRANKTALSKLQLWMLQEIVFQEAVIKRDKKRLEELRGDATAEGKGSPEVESIRREMFVFRTYANAIRAIGDGIAWRALGYDRAVIRLMCERATKQQILSEGLMAELLEWAAHFDQGSGIAILNSLTNCLAVGDVTVVRDDGTAEIVEVKSSNTKSGRKIRQKHKMREVATVLSAGEGNAEGKEVQIEILPIKPEAGLDRIGELLSQAERQGWASSQISACLYVECFDLEKFESVESAELAWKEANASRQGIIGDWGERDDLVMQRNSLDLMAFSPNCAPFSVFPFPTRICVDLMIGRKFYVSYLNVQAVAREFEFRGWRIAKTAEELLKEERPEQVLVVQKGRFHAGVPPADFMRMQMEALRPQTVISTYETKFKEGPAGSSGFTLSLYEGEPELWD